MNDEQKCSICDVPIEQDHADQPPHPQCHGCSIVQNDVLEQL